MIAARQYITRHDQSLLHESPIISFDFALRVQSIKGTDGGFHLKNGYTDNTAKGFN